MKYHSRHRSQLDQECIGSIRGTGPARSKVGEHGFEGVVLHEIRPLSASQEACGERDRRQNEAELEFLHSLARIAELTALTHLLTDCLR